MSKDVEVAATKKVLRMEDDSKENVTEAEATASADRSWSDE